MSGRSSPSGLPGGIGPLTSPGIPMTSGAFGVSGFGGCSIIRKQTSKNDDDRAHQVQQAHQQQASGR
jgi:hypothetical protein